ncbi:hypothetical protein [Taibaiella soli]|uniref:Uncharacterized protein n=1 Tax=Taibaiella soli TaxID=1649169 RepID=A0A2W2BC63_9BACT|nr:hypothetical protein [Taibaiella soli]PZF71256.1 hypothetical protein DN068_18330 [Taibaiella soli]
MELINDHISFTDRFLYPRVYYWADALMASTLVLLSVSSDATGVLIVCFATGLFLFLFGIVDRHEYEVNWIDTIDVDEENATCHLRLLKKDAAFMDIVVPVRDLRFEVETIVDECNFYRLNIYLSGKLIFEQEELCNISRKKMHEIVRYFHGVPK